MAKRASLLIIYTGGTIGMVVDQEDGGLKPFDFVHLTSQVPELNKFDVTIHAKSFEEPIDSSNISPELWVDLVRIIHQEYDDYDGFVILHGSDTMAYTASALSFMLENLNKPVILTGSQLPIGMIRTDGKENLISSIEIAASSEGGKALVPEVAVYFENCLMRGNRSHKTSADHFEAFVSPNYPLLAEAGVHIRYNRPHILPESKEALQIHTQMETGIGVLMLFPGIQEAWIRSCLETPGTKGIVLLTYGSGNSLMNDWFLDLVKKAVDRGIILLNITQCEKGQVVQGKYETSFHFHRLGLIGGGDMTVEAAVTKLMYLFGRYDDPEKIKHYLSTSIRGELSL